MTTYRLYLSDNLASSPFPTDSRELRVSAGASVIQHAPGFFDAGQPGTTDSGEWFPASNVAHATLSNQIETAGSADQRNSRPGWVWAEQDLDGRTLAAGDFTVQLRLSAAVGSGLQGQLLLRVAVVSGASGLYETKTHLTSTQITGESSHTSGCSFWMSNGARFGVSALSTISKTFPVTSHTFSAGERILVELGFGDADSTTDRTWLLESNNSNVFIDTTDIPTGPTSLTPVASAGQECTATPMVLTKNLRPVPVTP
jgi:hypothetical protein